MTLRPLFPFAALLLCGCTAAAAEGVITGLRIANVAASGLTQIIECDRIKNPADAATCRDAARFTAAMAEAALSEAKAQADADLAASTADAGAPRSAKGPDERGLRDP